MSKLQSQGATLDPPAPPAPTAAEILAWPPTVDIPTAAPAFGLSPSSGYYIARNGNFPAKVIRAGKHYRVITSSVWDVLGLSPDSTASNAG